MLFSKNVHAAEHRGTELLVQIQTSWNSQEILMRRCESSLSQPSTWNTKHFTLKIRFKRTPYFKIPVHQKSSVNVEIVDIIMQPHNCFKCTGAFSNFELQWSAVLRYYLLLVSYLWAYSLLFFSWIRLRFKTFLGFLSSLCDESGFGQIHCPTIK